VQRRASAIPAFREALLCEGVDTLLAGDVDTGYYDPDAQGSSPVDGD
jgi:hypothetical protein